jgi:hypothetical protein
MKGRLLASQEGLCSMQLVSWLVSELASMLSVT